MSKRERMRELIISLSKGTDVIFTSEDVNQVRLREEYTMDEMAEGIHICIKGKILIQLSDKPYKWEWIRKFDPNNRVTTLDRDN